MTTLPILKAALQMQEALILVMNDVEAKKVAVAWKIYDPSFTDSEYKQKEDHRIQLLRLWERVEPIDMSRLAEIAGVPLTRAAKAFARLKASRLIWPDGSMSLDVRKIIAGDVGLKYRPMMPKQAAAGRPEKGKTDERKPESTNDKSSNRKPPRAKARV